MKKFALVLLPLLATGAFAQEATKGLGLEVGAFFPMDKETKELFGNTWLTVGPGSVSQSSIKAGKITSAVSFIQAQKDGNKVVIVPLSLVYKTLLGDENAAAVPYYSLGAGAYYSDYSVNRGSGSTFRRDSAKVFGSSAFGEVGITFVKRARVTARYNTFSTTHGLKFDGWELVGSIDLFKW
ncbi:MAG: hypothetical protein ACOYON_10725 [Fimbriimonas sp.]